MQNPRPDLEVLRRLKESGAKINEKDNIGKAAVYEYFKHPKPSLPILDYLLKNGLEVNGNQGFFQRTPLHWAMEHENPDLNVIKLLLNHGADGTVKDQVYRTPLEHHQVKFPGNEGNEAVELLKDHISRLEKGEIIKPYEVYLNANTPIDKSISQQEQPKGFWNTLLSSIKNFLRKILELFTKK